MAKDRLRLAILGMGSAGLRHLQAAIECPDVQLVGVADSLPGPREKARAHGVVTANDLNGLLKLEPDAVVVALPHAMLPEAAHRILDARAHILIEKPLALDVAAAEDVAEHARSTDVHLMVNFNHRFRPEYMRAHELVREGTVGEVTFVNAHMSSGAGPLPGWVWDPETAGGGMMTYNGIHTLDHLIWLAGSRPVRVAAMSSNLHYHKPLEDTLSSTIQLESGALATVSQVKTGAEKTLGIWETTVVGKQGALKVGNGGTVTCSSLGKDLEEILPKQNRFRSTLDHFAQSILAGKAPVPGAADAIIALKTLTALYQSAESGTVVGL